MALINSHILNKISKKKWININNQKIKNYDEIRDRFVTLFKTSKEVVGLYEFGKVKNLGISDLDLAIVLSKYTRPNNTFKKKLEKIYSMEDFNDLLCGGTVMLFSEDTFPNLNLLDDINVRCLYGKKIDLITHNLTKDNLIKIFQVFDWFPERLLSLSKALSNDKVITRSILGYLYSLKYTFYKLNQLGIVNDIKLISFISSIESLRDNWFNSDPKKNHKKLFQLIIRAFKLGEKYMLLFSTWSLNKFSLNNENVRLPKQFNLSSKSGFIANDKKLNYLGYLQKSLNSNKFFLPVPSIWMFHWSIYGNFNGYISQKITQNLIRKPKFNLQDLNSQYMGLAKERISLCNDMAEFLNKIKIKKGLYKFGWFY
jgi:hypothetical protein